MSLGVAGRLLYRRLLYPIPTRAHELPRGPGVLSRARAADGVEVLSLDFAGPSDAPTVVHFHGNSETIADAMDFGEELAARGLSVRLVEYRGYGGALSPRDPHAQPALGPGPTEEGLYADAEAALADLKTRGVGPERVVLSGRSLGTGVAAEMACRGRGARLVLVSPYTSIPDVAQAHVPWLPMRLLIGDRYDTLAKAPQLGLPALIVHGEVDRLIAAEQGRTLRRVMAHARWRGVPGAGHNNVLLLGGQALWDEIADFAKGASAR